MHHRLNAGQGIGHCGPVPDVRTSHRYTMNGVGRRGGVGGRMAGVEHAHLMPGVLQGGGHVAADETGAAGHEYVGHLTDPRLGDAPL